MEATHEGSARLWQRRSRATRSRWRSRAKAFWRGVQSTSGPPGLSTVKEEEQQEEKEDQSEFLEGSRFEDLDKKALRDQRTSLRRRAGRSRIGGCGGGGRGEAGTGGT